MAVKFRSVATDTNTAGVNEGTVVITKPSQTADGDIMIAVVSGPFDTTWTSPAGWISLGTVVGGTAVKTHVFKRIASSEGASYTFTSSSSGAINGSIASFMGGHEVLIWASRATGTTDPASGWPLDAARDAVGWGVYSWRNDTADATVLWSFGQEKHDVTAQGAAAIRRGQSGFYYGPPDLNDIVNIGDTLPSPAADVSTAPLGGTFVSFLISDVAPDAENWTSTNGSFAVDLELDHAAVNSTGSVTTEFKGDISSQVVAFTERGENAPNEITEKLVDGLASTKWLDFSATSWVQYDFGASNAKVIKRYRLTSGNDTEARDPMNWTLQGSNNGSSFTVLDTRTNQGFGNRGEVREFSTTNTTAYRYYRLDITANKSSGATAAIQLAEFRLSTVAAWEDVTTFVNEEAKIRITRGLQGSSGRSDFTRAYVEFNNTDGRFSPRNQDGAYYGAIQRNTQMRISKAYGTKSLQLQGAVRLEGTDMCGDAVRCPLTAALSATGDLDVRIDLELESWRDEQMLCGLAVAEGGSEGWSLYVDSSGVPRLTWHDGGANFFDVSSELALPQVTRQALRVVLDVDNGASGKTITFYTSDTINGSWSRLGSTITLSGTTSIGYSGGALCVGHVAGRSQRGIHGLVYGFELRNGGSLVCDIDFTALANGSHTFVDSESRSWITVNNAVISNRRYRFHGEVAEWPGAWDSTGTWVYASATGAGVQKRLERSSNPLSVMRRYHTKGVISDPGAFERYAEPAAYWPLEDKKGAFQIASGLPGKPQMQIYGTPLFEESDGEIFNESDQLIKLNGAKLGGRVTESTSGYADIRWIQYSPTGIADAAEVLEFYSTGSLVHFQLSYVTDNTWRLRGFNESDSGSVNWDSGSRTITTEGKIMHVQLILNEVGANISVTMNAYDKYGTSLGTWTDSFLTATLGRIYRVNINPEGDLTDTYIGHLALYGSDSPTFNGTQINAHHYEPAGSRIKRLCEEERIEFRWIGAISETSFMGYQSIDSPFNEMSNAVVSDGGFLVDPLDAFGIELRTLRSLFNQPAHLELSYTSGELSGEMQPVSDDAYIVNDFTANRGDAGGARFRRTDGSLSTDDPPLGVGTYEQSQSYSLAHEGQCVDIASWEVHKGTLDEERYTQIEIALENLRIAASSALIERILLLDVGDRIDITDTPGFLPAEDIRQVVIGYEEWFDNFQHDFQLNTVPERVYEVAEYDSWANFDAHDSSLYRDINSTETAIPTRVDTGQKWTDDVESMPFSIRVDGEVMRVVAPGELVNANPFFDASTTGWSAQAAAIARSTTYIHPHPDALASVRVTPDGSLGSANCISDNGIPVVPQNTYRCSAWFYNPDGYDSVRVRVNWHNSGGTYLSTSSGTAQAITAGTWTYLQADFVAPASAATGRPMTSADNSPTASEIYYAWAVRLTEEVSAGDESWLGDSFNRADSTTTMGNTDGDGTIGTWIEDAGTWGIISNTAYITASANSVTTVAGNANLELLQVEVPTWASGEANLVFRFTDTSNYLRFGGTLATAAILEQVVAGVATTIATADDDQGLFTLAAGQTLAVRCNGSVIECFVNGIMALCVSDTTQQTATRMGLRATVNTTRFDDFYAESTASTQVFTVERGVNGAAAPHKSDVSVSLYKSPFRGM